MAAFHLPKFATGEAPACEPALGLRIERRIPAWGLFLFAIATLEAVGSFTFASGGQAERLKSADATGQQVRALERQVSQIDQRTTDMQGDLREIRRVLDRDRGS